MIGIPLAVMASLFSQPWCLPALVVCAWWWAPRDHGGEWVVAVGRGLLGAEWAFCGVGALVSFPRERVLVEVCWVLLGILLALWAKVATS
jgi:hypothetical protein